MGKLRIKLNKYGRFEPQEQTNNIIKKWQPFSRLDSKHPIDFATYQQAKTWIKALKEFQQREKDY